MKQLDDINAFIGKINDETNSIAAKVDAQTATIKALQDQLAAGTGIDAVQLDPVVANLSSISERLGAVAADPTNPIPGFPAGSTDSTGTATASPNAGSTPAADPTQAKPADVADAGAVTQAAQQGTALD